MRGSAGVRWLASPIVRLPVENRRRTKPSKSHPCSVRSAPEALGFGPAGRILRGPWYGSVGSSTPMDGATHQTPVCSLIWRRDGAGREPSRSCTCRAGPGHGGWWCCASACASIEGFDERLGHCWPGQTSPTTAQGAPVSATVTAESSVTEWTRGTELPPRTNDVQTLA